MSQVENLRELSNHPGWSTYLDVIEEKMQGYFMELFQLEPSKADNFVQFVILKSKIDELRDITYFIERQVVEQERVPMVDKAYGQRFFGLLKKIWRKG